ncbi:MAG: AmmeMemoRadiSam system radical SAM enzyme [Ignavibacteriales bacterium]|nr:AmmeMemoRadiSam system radical SAM enzyme [Ignavibacteriales bacterium]
MNAQTLKQLLTESTRQGELYKHLEKQWVRCFACGHRCKIAPGKEGICKVRFNRDGVLYVPYGYAAGIQVDPIEKKPFYHAYPGAKALSFGMLGCDYHCGYCQNWITSQTLRDPQALATPDTVTAAQMVGLALRHGAKVVASTYNEPLITSEWAVEVFKMAKQAGLVTSYVSNGNATPEVLDYLQPWLDLYKVDLKGFSQKEYSKLGGTLKTVLETIASVHKRGVWMEVVTLVVPGFNDSDGELRDIANFLVSVSPEIPWHVTAFHQDYKMTEYDSTPNEALVRAAEIGYDAGLKFVYAGNRPGETGGYEHTYCPKCDGTLIERFGFRVISLKIVHGACPACGEKIPGRW